MPSLSAENQVLSFPNCGKVILFALLILWGCFFLHWMSLFTELCGTWEWFSFPSVYTVLSYSCFHATSLLDTSAHLSFGHCNHIQVNLFILTPCAMSHASTIIAYVNAESRRRSHLMTLCCRNGLTGWVTAFSLGKAAEFSSLKASFRCSQACKFLRLKE